MTGQRASTDTGLRLVPAQPDDARPSADPRPTALHALGGQADVVQAASVVASHERAGVFRQLLVHTGEAREHAVPAELRADPGMPEPDQWLGAVEGRRAEQTAAMLAAFERLLAAEQPAVAVVYGHGDAALACALAASKTGIALAHVGSGLRSSRPTAASEASTAMS
jgi:UDP-N-acetylglucosamine 2-epimerase (non-hydrolysing)